MPASPSTARAINDRVALQLLQREGPLTAGQLKTGTGLSRPSVADLVERLQRSGLIEIVGESGAERRGPNARLYGIVADRAHLAALDIRTQSVSLVVADLLGATLAEASMPIDGDIGTEPTVERVAALVERTVREGGADRLHSVCIGMPGLINPSTGELRSSIGLPRWHRQLVAALQERLTARIILENETNLAGVAEQRAGAGRDHDTFVFVWLGDGVGAALFLDGRLRRGLSGGAGEIGFLPLPDTGGLPSATDCRGGFHSLGGATALFALAEEQGIDAHGILGITASEARGGVAAALVTEAIAAGQEGFLDALAQRLALAAASIVSIVDPGQLVLGGEVGLAGGAELALRVESQLAALIPLPTQVRPGELGGTAVLRGALLTARDVAQEELFGPGG